MRWMVPQRLLARRVLPPSAPLRVTRHPTCALAPAFLCVCSGSASMAKDENSKSFAVMSVVDVAELLGVTDRGVRKWIKEKGLPAKPDPRGFILDWPSVLRWYVEYKIAENGGTGGTGAPGTAGIEPVEDYDQALARKTRAEADLKELQLARERSEVAAIADVEKVMSNSAKSIQTLLLALASSLTPKLIGVTDRNKIFAEIDRAVRAALGNLPNVNAVREARKEAVEEDSE